MIPDPKDSFRDHLATADERGNRIWVYPTKPKGRFHTARMVVSWFLLAFLFGAPFIKVNGHPILLFDIINRKFIIFGLTFWPQDFHLFVLATITLVVFVILFTAVFGRLFCGWVCPQTVFMEMVFRKIEFFIEGNAGAQKRLANSPWNVEKIFKKGIKNIIFYALSFIIGNTFLAYIIGVDDLFKIMTDPPSQHVLGLVIMLIFSLVFYWVFAWFREQACTLVCPYGRLQSVLLDKHSIVVAYDYKRGEPRGVVDRNEDFSKRGHCISCDACVKVCPTGIDIRNGTQLECINCTACIDACDHVMDKVELPHGLIRYASGNLIETGQRFKITPRIILYSSVLTVLLTLITIFMVNRTDIETTILRTPGTLYELTADGKVRNLYTIKMVNKTYKPLKIDLKLKNPPGTIDIIGPDIVIEQNGYAESVFFVDIDSSGIYNENSLISLDIYSNGELVEEIKTNFRGPRK